MLRIRTRGHIFFGTVTAVVIAVLLILAHVEINYPAEIRSYVRVKAVAATVVVSAIISFFIMIQLRRTFLLNQELQRLLDRDRLTNVATRDFFFARMQENPTAYGISLMVDIDFFKSVNDTYGHLAGDAVIRRVAEILHDNVRENDIVCRFGGEEFIVFLHEKTADAGYIIAERMRTAIANETFVYDSADMRVTVSIGGSLKQRVMDVEKAIKDSDRALYRAKAGGRNKTVFARDFDHSPEETAA